MNAKTKHGCRRLFAMLLVIITVMSLIAVPASAGQEDGYHDPAERWMNASNRTNELDVNATVTHETFHCYICKQPTSFKVWRTPEYTKDGQTAMTRNIRYSDGTLLGGSGTGTILDGTPGVNATYTGYHWTKACCETCGTMNANLGLSDYALSKNVYWLYDCATAFTEYLDDVVTYEYADSTYHKKIVDGGSYCEFCYGTRHTHSETLEPHDLHVDIIPQLGNQRFAVVEHCHDCEYTAYSFVAAKAVVADYYGVVDGQAHTLVVSDLSDAGVTAKIRYGNTAETCTMTTPPSYTEEGQYTVYYQIDYTYQGVGMTENGVAYVWLRDDSLPELPAGPGCDCGCGDPDCDCEHGHCPHCEGHDCSKGDHNYIFIDTVRPTCDTLGYDRYICTICGTVEKRNYVNAIGHAWQSVLVREADCVNTGKILEICRNCGTVKETVTPKGEHSWSTYNVAATCTMPGYSVRECSRCGERQITNLTAALGHNYKAYVTPATCVTGGKTVYVCDRCGDSYVGGYTDAKGHRFDSGTIVVKPSCTGEGLKEYTCIDCGYKFSETLPAADHNPGAAATCTEPQLCTACGAVLEHAHGHDFRTTVVAPACEKMGYTVFTCKTCDLTYKGEYTDALGHNYKAVVTAPTCKDKGYTTYTCTRCGDSYVDNYTDALGHDWDNGTKIADATCNGAGVIEYRCKRCDATYLEAISAAGHNPGSKVTCTEPQLCLTCGAVLAKPTGHSYKATVTPATCEAMGYTTYTCRKCGDTYKADYTDALGHDYVAVVTAPTCTEGGYTTYTCSRCGDSYVSDYTDALGHAWNDGEIIANPTCTSDGVVVFTCTVCGKEHSERLLATGHFPGEPATCTESQLCLTCGAVLEKAHGHSFEAEVTEPTCEKMGFTTYTCAECGLNYTGKYTDALGHDYVATVTEPTCTEMGYTTWTCSRCGKTYIGRYTAPTGHAWDEGTVIAEPCCTGEGVKEYVCLACGEKRIETIPATGHTPGDPNTCTDPQICVTCGAIIEKACGHNISAEVTEPTCEAMGYTTYSCAECGLSYTGKYTDALGHDYVAVVTEPTCTEKGYTIWTCSRCGKTYIGRYTDPTGHQWDEGTVIAEPCCTGEGVKEYVCLACGEKRSETIPATGHNPGDPASCTEPQICVTCGAIVEKAHGHNITAVVTDATCLKMGWTTYTCEVCGLTYKSDYTDALGHDYVPTATEPTCTEKGYTTWTCSRCGDSYVTDYVDPLGHEWDEGRELISTSCNGAGLIDHRCVRCDYHYLEAVSPEGHNPGPEADCIHPQICLDCGAVLVQATGHNYEAVVTEPTCTEMGYTTYTCSGCGDSYKSDYTKANGHKEGDWIMDKEPTTEAEGQRHKVCTVCGETLITEVIEKLYNMATTDSKGEAIVGGYLVIVTDTDTKNPVANATVILNKDGSISIRLPDGRILDYADQTTVTVLLTKDKTPVKDMQIVVTDKNGNYSAEKTDANGQVTVPGTTGITGPDGKVTIGWIDADGNRYTITLKVVDYENGRPIEGAVVTIGKTGNITVVLPDGIDIDAADRILLLLTDNLQKPLPGWTIIVKGDKDSETGETDEDGILIVPESVRQEKHAAYIVGYPDGTFGPERNMTRAEATAIFARLLADKKGDTIVPVENAKFEDIPENAWYSGYVRYLNNYGVVYGTNAYTFSPDVDITRAEFVAMAVRFFEVYGDGNPAIMEQYTEFNDVSDGYWAAQYIKDAAIYGWIRGYGDGTFRADQEITRAEVVTIVNRLLDRSADKAYLADHIRDLNTFSDMKKTHWAYYAVMEAANAHIATFDEEEAWSK